MNGLCKEIIQLFSKGGIFFFLFIFMLATVGYDNHVYIKVLVCSIMLFKLYNKWDYPSSLIIIFSLLYVGFLYLFELSESNYESLCLLLCPIVFYSYGRYLRYLFDDNEFAICWLLIAISICWQLWYHILHDVSINGLVTEQRNMELEGKIMSSTVWGMLLSIGISCVSFLFSGNSFFSQKTLIFVVISLISVYCIIHMINRTGLVLAFITILVSLFFYIKNSRSSLVVIILIILAYLSTMVTSEVSVDIVAAYQNRELDEEFAVATAGGRIQRWCNSFIFMYKYPFGWRNFETMGYSHNLWLDIARSSGVLPFCVFLHFSWINLKRLYWVYKYSDNNYSAFLAGIILCVVFQCSVEPVIEARSTYFFIFCFLLGYLYEYSKDYSPAK